jgi:hypothetical protein
MQWVQDPSQSSVDNLNVVRLEASRHFRNKKKEYVKAEIEILENEKNEMGGACSTCGGRERCIQGFDWGNLRDRDYLRDPVVDGRIILRWIFRK